MARFKIKRQAEADFTEQNLPHNRIDAFRDCIKLRWRELFLIGAIVTASMLPIFALGIARDSFIADALSRNEMTSARYTLLFFDAISIVFYLLPGLAFSGAFRIIRNIAWADILFFKEDFRDGVRLNYKIFAPVFLLLGAGIFFVDYFMISASNDILKGVPMGLCVMLFIPMAIFVIAQGTVYNISLGRAMKNSVYLFAKSVLPSLLASIITLLPAAFSLFSNTLTKHLCLIGYTFVFIPWVCLGLFLFGCSALDRHINEKHHPEIVGKGLAKIKKEEN